jgi:endonuclease/exonuclease/phosphatase (EEP) superfamily protein YafD
MILGLGSSTRIYFFRESFVAELAISFLPYFAAGFIVLSVILLIIVLLKKKKGSAKVLALLLIWSAVLGMLYGTEFFSFYSLHPKEQVLSAGLKIYYANILYTNNDYESLKKQIEENKADLVILVEFSNEHENAMKGRFQERFPYVDRNSRSKKLAGNVVFSKYPITNLSEKYPQPSGRRRYNYFSVDKGIPLYFYVIHTSAPVSQYNFQMRNEQLKKLKTDFLTQSSDRAENAPVVVLGDFNLSPRSAFYTQFMSGLEGKLKNVSRDYQPHFTRSLRDQKILNVHIDQVFASPQVNIGDLGISDLSGSDHHAMMFNVEAISAQTTSLD